MWRESDIRQATLAAGLRYRAQREDEWLGEVWTGLATRPRVEL
jgi:hypothetical protein